MAGETKGRVPHILAIPFPYQGHIFSMLQFTKRVIALHRIEVTFVAYEDTIRLLATSPKVEQQQQESAAAPPPPFSADGVHEEELFHFAVLPRIKGQPEGSNIQEKAKHLKREFDAFFENFIRERSAGPQLLPNCILADMALIWIQDTADNLRIPRYMFVPSGASLAVSILGFARIYEQGDIQISEEDGKLVDTGCGLSFPGLPHLRHHETPFAGLNYPAEHVIRSRNLWRAAGVVVNTFYDLEDQIIESFNVAEPPQAYRDRKAPKFYPVGPLLSTLAAEPHSNVTLDQSRQHSANEALDWLSLQPLSSVLYVAFGTVVGLSAENIHELALALEASQQRFLWALRDSDCVSRDGKSLSAADALPAGFSSRVRERGVGFVVTGFAPQIQILAHKSTAAFLTHCGWNSALESTIMGKPMIAWPQGSEQHLNCRVLMDVLKVAEQIQTGPENILDQVEAVRAIRLVMVEPQGKAIEERIKELQKLAAKAIVEDASQSRFIQSFAEDIALRTKIA